MEDKEAEVYYLSFATETIFLGACWVRALGPEHAVLRTWEMEINPGGEVMIIGPLKPDQIPDRAVYDRLLSMIEVEIIQPSMTLGEAEEQGWTGGFIAPVMKMDAAPKEDDDAADG